MQTGSMTPEQQRRYSRQIRVNGIGNEGQELILASRVLVVGMGAALYPQAIQRIYAARSAATLRRSLSVMAFLPITARMAGSRNSRSWSFTSS